MPADGDATRGHRRPLWLGLLLAPWAAPLALAAMAWASDRLEGGTRSGSAALEVLAFALALGLPLAYVATALFGLPWVVWLRARGRLVGGLVLLAAAPFGSAAMLLGLAEFGARLGFAAQIGIGACLGLAVALAFCVLCGIPWRRAGPIPRK
jgi:hypothetical protein